MLQSNVVVRESYHDGIETSMLSIDDGKAMVDTFGVNLLDFGFHNGMFGSCEIETSNIYLIRLYSFENRSIGSY
jgi:hypothetical protein